MKSRAFVVAVRIDMAPDCTVKQASQTIKEEIAKQWGEAALVLEVREEKSKRQPMQPIEAASDEVVRFRENAIVRALLDFATGKGFGLNEIARHVQEKKFNRWDLMQLDQLIGYSVSGYGELSYVDRVSLDEADAVVDELLRRSEK